MDAVNGFTMTSCFLSIGGAAVIFYSYIKIPKFKTDTTKMLVWLTIADVINASGNFLGTFRYIGKYGNKYDIDEYLINGTCQDTTDTACVFQSLITTYASMASFFWTFFISLHHFLLIRREKGLNSTKERLLCHVTGWGIPGALYGLGKLHLYRESKGQRRRRQDIDQEAEEDRKKYGIFWLIFYFYITRLWGTARYFIYLAHVVRGSSDETIANIADNALLYIQNIGDSSQAFVNFILFCVLGGVMGKFPCCRKTSETDHLVDSGPLNEL